MQKGRLRIDANRLGAWVACALLLLAAAAAAAGEGTRRVAHRYGLAEGLPVDSVLSGAIDGDGFLWLATHDGLARFDGERFEVHESMRFPAMSGNRVASVHVDPAGRMYAHTEHGDWLHVRSGDIDAVALGAAREPVRHVDTDSLCVTTARALHCPDGAGGYLARVTFPAGVEAAIGLPGKGGEVWMLTTARRPWLYRQGRWVEVPWGTTAAARRPPAYAAVDAGGNLYTELGGRVVGIPPAGPAWRLHGEGDPRDIAQLRRDAHGRIWVGAANGVFVIEAGVPRKVFAAGAGPDSLHRSWPGQGGGVWVSESGRLWRVDEDGGPAEAVFAGAGEIRDVLQDDAGQVWVMTLREGLHRLSAARVELLAAEDGVGAGNVYGVAHGADGTTWLGTLGDGLLALDASGRVQRLGRADGLPGDHPWLVAVAPDGGVYVASYAPGLWYRAPGGARFSALPLPPALHGQQVLAVAFDAAGEPWLGTSAGAWRRKAGAWGRAGPPGGPGGRVNALLLEAEDAWFGGTSGVWYQGGNGGYPVAPALLGTTPVRDLHRASDGALWISTEGRGLLRVDPADPGGRHALQLGRAQGLPSNSPHAVREDAAGHLWVNSNQGIFRISRPALQAVFAGDAGGLSPLVLGRADGLARLEGNGGVQPAAAWDGQGRLLFPSQRGVVRFDPLQIPLHDEPPRALVQGLEAGGRRLALGPGNRLPAGIRSMTVHYSAANLAGGGQSRFRYRLWPLETRWTDAFAARSTSFAALAPGRYRFELLAGNGDGVWASVPASLGFEIPPYWHERRAVRVGSLLLAAAILALALQLRFRRLHRQAERLDRQVRERTRELAGEKLRAETTLVELAAAHAELGRTHQEIAERNLRLAAQAERLEQLGHFRSRLLADVGHELRTPLMLVELPLRELEERSARLPKGDRDRLAVPLRQLARLRSLVEQLLHLAQAEAGQVRLAVRRLDPVALLSTLAEDYRPMARRAGVELVTELAPAAPDLHADRGHLATVLGNLLDNAIRHAPAGTAVELRLGWDADHMRIQVRDRGPGFGPELAVRLFERFERGEGPPLNGREGLGIGLALARELVERHGGRISAASTPGAGAVFEVRLPLGSAHFAPGDIAADPCPAESADAVRLAARNGQAAGGRLLLVEDHPELAGYLAARLAEHVPVECVGSGEDALAGLSRSPEIALVVSDVVLPGISGIELCRRLRGGSAAGPPVVLVSARGGGHERAEGLAAGAAAYLVKPFSIEDLLGAVASAWPAAVARLGALPADPEAVAPLLALALEQLADPGFSVGDWATRAHLSERQLRRRVHALCGQAPQVWLREQRLLAVRRLLGSGECRTLAEAGARCGLDNPAYLYRSYRARFGAH